MKQFSNYIHEILYPALFENITAVFPEMNFKKEGSRWQTNLKLDGTAGKDGKPYKSVITSKCFKRVLEQGGESKDLLTFYKEKNGISSTLEAVREISERLGLSLPSDFDEAAYSKYREQREGLEAAAARMGAALWSPEGRAALEYLKAARGYSEEFIRAAEFGFCSAAEAALLRPLLTYIDEQGTEHTLPAGIGSSYILAIPFRTGGEIVGFKFRVTDGTVPKYKDAFKGYRHTQKYHLFGLSGLNCKSRGDDKSRDLVIMEGELDALRAAYEIKGENVAAAAGGEIYAEALAEAAARGIKRVTLLFDTEETKEQQAATDKKIKKAVRTIYEAGLYPLVAVFPKENEGGKVDADSYLKSHSGEQLAELIRKADAAPMYLYKDIVRNELSKEGVAAEGTSTRITARTMEEIKRQAIDIANLPYILPTDRDLIYKAYSDNTGNTISAEAIEAEADAKRAAEAGEQQKEALLNTIRETRRIATEKEPEAVASALEYLEERLEPLRDISRQAEFSGMLKLPKEKDIKAEYKESPSGIPTQYYFGYGEEQEQLELRAGALTYVCAQISHGKSKFLENLAIQAATAKDSEGEGGSVLYFTFEEARAAVSLQLFNIYLNVDLSRNNIKSLISYYKNGANYFRGNGIEIIQQKDKEYTELLTSGKLRIYTEPRESRALVEAIRYINSNIKVKAVFIDYIQLLRTKGSTNGRKEELAAMCRELMATAKDTGLPIILGAQLNRDAASPLEMVPQQIADASEIEHSANTIILLWNSNVRPLPRSNAYYIKGANGKKELSEEAQLLSANGLELGKDGKIYAILAKNRGGRRNIDTILSFRGNTGKIDQIEPPTEENRQPL